MFHHHIILIVKSDILQNYSAIYNDAKIEHAKGIVEEIESHAGTLALFSISL